MTSLLTGAIAEPALADLFDPLLTRIGWTGVTDNPAVKIGLALFVANVASMLIGELVPKNFAIAKPYAIAVLVAIPMAFLNRLLRPVILFLNRSANWTVRRFGIEPREELAGVRSLEELELMIRSSGKEGELDDAELSLLTRAISFTEKVAGDVMVPRVAVDSLSRHDSVADLRRLARDTGHSRFPVTGEDLDEVVGVVHVKDSFKVPPERRSITPVGHIAKPALAVPDSRPLDQLLIDMQRQSRALAIVVDEYGGTAGIITIEDLLEEILGEIADEHDPVDTNGSTLPAGNQREVQGQDQPPRPRGGIRPDPARRPFRNPGRLRHLPAWAAFPSRAIGSHYSGWMLRGHRDGRSPDRSGPTHDPRGPVMNFSACFWMFVSADRQRILRGRRVRLHRLPQGSNREGRHQARQGGSRGDERVVRHPGRRPSRHHPGNAASRFRGRTIGGAVAGDSALGWLPISTSMLHSIALVIAILIVVFLHMVIGEMAPKNIAIATPERLALWLALPWRAYMTVFRPLVFVLNRDRQPHPADLRSRTP